jgi:hypothetical protein
VTSHKVPTHLSQPDGLGRFSYRQIVLLGGSALFLLPPVWGAVPKTGPSFGDLIRTVSPGMGLVVPAGSFPIAPIVVTFLVWLPFLLAALPLDPPFEHGLFCAIAWFFHRGYRELDDVDSDLGGLAVKGNQVISDQGYHAVWELPSINLRLADAAEVDQAQDHWGEFLTGITASCQAMTRSTRIDPAFIVGSIERYPNDNAKKVAAWLKDHAATEHLIERRHFLSTFGENKQSFSDSELEIADGLSALGFRRDLVRRLEGRELQEVVQATFSPLMPKNNHIGPLGKPFNASSAWYADEEWHLVLAFGRWPRILRDNALAPIIDGDLPLDVSIDIERIEADDILDGLERRSVTMKATHSMGPYRKRSLAIEDLDDFIVKLESGEEAPFDVAVYLHLHGPKKKVVERDAKRIKQRVRRYGARANDLRWEQADAMLCVAPLAINTLDRRTKRVDTSSVKRLFPWTASSMSIEGGIPWGETLDSNRPVLWTPWRRPMIANPHLVVYMMSGGGKGFAWKVWSSRALFGGVTQEFFGFDQAEEDLALGEYGKWSAYCGIEYRHVKTRGDFVAALADLDNYRWLGPGICWNIAQLPTRDRPEFLAQVKTALWRRASEHQARRQWFVDELWSFVKINTDMGVDPAELAHCLAAIEDLIRTGRHVQVGAAMFTQRAKDSIEVPLMQVIQSQAASQMFGMQRPGEISDVADRLHWTAADIKQIKKFSPGQAILEAGPWRVAMRVTASDDEYEMANTDGKPARVLTLPSSESEEDVA